MKMKTADVFVLTGTDGKLLDPASQSTILAQYSRSPKSARELLQSVTPESAAAFQEKWGVNYGHSSIAELCTVPYCFENVSIVASKFLERYQRAGYSEKSTRYQVFSEESFIEPAGAPPELREAAALLYRTYRDLEGPTLRYVAELVGGGPIEEVMKKPSVKARAFDSLRYLLPAGTGTNLAGVFNARDARYVMSDLLGSRLPELRDIGMKMVEAARRYAPVFAMGAKENTYELPVRSLGRLPSSAPPADPFARLIEPVGRHSEIEEAFWGRVSTWHGMTKTQFSEHMEKRGKQQVPDIFKTVRVTYDMLMDYGAFRDLQRHRRCEQYIEPLGINYGYVVPEEFDRPGFAGRSTGFWQTFYDRYCEAMNTVQSACERMLAAGVDPEVVQYAIPLGFLHRSQFEMDLREVYYITELRTQPQGHISYRRIAWEMAEEARGAFPSLMQWCRATKPEKIEEHR